MDLYSDQPLPLTVRIVVYHRAHELAVYIVDEHIAGSNDVDSVPALFDTGSQFFVVAEARANLTGNSATVSRVR